MIFPSQEFPALVSPLSHLQLIHSYWIALTLDLMDAADQHQNNVEKDVIKTKLSSTGQSLGPFSGKQGEIVDSADGHIRFSH